MTRYRQYRTPIFLTGAATLCVVFGAGCTDLKPTQAQLDDLKSQVTKLSAQTASVERQANSAADAARAASSSAQHAKSTADTANSTATRNQQAIEAINEKIDRMFKHKLSK